MLKNTKFKKFSFNPKVRTLMIIVCIATIFLYLAIIFNLNSSNITPNTLLYQVLLVLKEVLVVVFSIIFTTLLTTWLVEVDTRNKMYRDIICNDFLASDEFYSSLSEENQKSMLENLERNHYFKGSVEKEQMYHSITEKLHNTEKNLYYNDCEYYITCKINRTMVEKKVKRVVKLRSFTTEETLENYTLISSTYGSKDGIKPMELHECKINDKAIPMSDITPEDVQVTKESLKNCGYDTCRTYKYNGPIKIHPDKDTVLTLAYTTYVDISDSSYACRVKYPCKNFSLTFNLDGTSAKNYALSAHAFGFIDDAGKSTNGANRSAVTIKFNDWIFDSDGVAVVISKK